MIATLPASLLAAIPLAIAAGLVSFVSPCVLPLLPGYLAFLTGATGWRREEIGSRVARSSVRSPSSWASPLVFVSIGALFGGFGSRTAQSRAVAGASLRRRHDRARTVLRGMVALVVAATRATSSSPATSLRARRGGAWGSPSGSVGRRASGPRLGAILRTRGVEHGCDGAARFHPRLRSTASARHSLRRRGAGHRVDGDRVDVATSTRQGHRPRGRRAAHRDRRAAK